MVKLWLLPPVRVVVGKVTSEKIGVAAGEVENNSTPEDKGGLATLVRSSLGLPLGPLVGAEELKGMLGNHGNIYKPVRNLGPHTLLHLIRSRDNIM